MSFGILSRLRDLFRGSDEVHEKMKEYAYKSEVGHAEHAGNGQYVWVQDKPESLQIPKSPGPHLNPTQFPEIKD